MSFFSKKPILRLFFVFVYACFAVWILIRDFAWLNILVSAFALLGSYVALAKSKLIKDKFSKNINDYSFDLYSIFLTIYFLVDLFFVK